MKQLFFISLACALLLCSCGGKSDADKAAALVEEGRSLAASGQLNEAKIRLDSVHHTYPKCVAQRRLARDLQDSITYVEAKRTLAYSDSLLLVLQPQADPLLKKFDYEKQDQYEDHGRYVHRLLNTDRNTQRCYLQAYVSDNHITTVKSYYYGGSELAQKAIELSVDEEVARFEGSLHSFEAEGYHSILSMDNDHALELLNFISSHMSDRIRINLVGTRKGDETNYVYNLSDNEKTALQDTYQLGFLMSDIRRLEDAVRVSGLVIGKYEKKHSML